MTPDTATAYAPSSRGEARGAASVSVTVAEPSSWETGATGGLAPASAAASATEPDGPVTENAAEPESATASLNVMSMAVADSKSAVAVGAIPSVAWTGSALAGRPLAPTMSVAPAAPAPASYVTVGLCAAVSGACVSAIVGTMPAAVTVAADTALIDVARGSSPAALSASSTVHWAASRDIEAVMAESSAPANVMSVVVADVERAEYESVPAGGAVAPAAPAE